MLVKWNPTRNFFAFDKDIDQFFDDFFTGNVPEAREATMSPRINLEENDNEWILTAELPGVKKDDVTVNFQDNLLTLTGEKKFEKEDKKKHFHRIERSYGQFSRSVQIPSSIVLDKIDARYEDGILNIILPKAEDAKPKQIAVKVK